MKSFCIIADTGRGKSTYVKKLLRFFVSKGLKPFIYDVNNEYGEFQETKELPKVSDFKNEATKKTNSVIVFEEATIFFSSNAKDEDLRYMLVRKRHTKNVIIFVFHSLRSVPVEILDLINFIILFKTSDRETLVKSKFREDTEILELFEQVKQGEKNNFHYHKVLSRNNSV